MKDYEKIMKNKKLDELANNQLKDFSGVNISGVTRESANKITGLPQHGFWTDPPCNRKFCSANDDGTYTYADPDLGRTFFRCMLNRSMKLFRIRCGTCG